MEIKPNFISPVAAELDKIQSEYDVVFVIAGTNAPQGMVGKAMKIGSPADSLNSLVVNSVDFKGRSASYTRSGPVLSFFNKPDLSYYGGDGKRAEDKIAVCCDNTGATYVSGTSFAAPWVSRKLAYLIQIMGLSRELAKAILIDSAAKWDRKDDISHRMGYGVLPKHIDDIIHSSNDEIRFLMMGTSEEYETSYIDVQRIIDLHIFKGRIDTPVAPVELSESELTLSQNMEKLVTLKGLKYANEAFALLYPDPNGDKKSNANRVFLSDKTWGITTWAMSKNKMQAYLDSGIWDEAKTADGAKTVAELRKENAIEATGTYVSQYFKMGGTEIQIRTSGYAKFADIELDPEVLSGDKLINVTGILTNYRGAPQFTIIDLEGVKVVEP